MTCQFCSSPVETRTELCRIVSRDLLTERKYPVKVNYCLNDDCAHSWIPAFEEKKLDEAIAKDDK